MSLLSNIIMIMPKATAPVNTVAPAVTGTAAVGATLSSTTGTWTGTPTITYAYQWQHTTTNIGGATSSTYVVESAYTGETIRCVVTATNGAGSVAANSNSTSAVIQYATWNPSDKNANLALSNGNRTATGWVTNWAAVRATLGKSSGKWYWEVHWDTSDSAAVALGIGTSSASIANGNFPGTDANGHGYYYSNGNYYTGNSPSAYGAGFAPGDTIGFALDMTGGTLTIYKNNSSQGVMVSGLSGTFYPMLGAGAAGAPILTANFGLTAFTYTPPSGYNSGVYI